MHKVNKSSNSYSSYVAILWILIVHLRFISLWFATPPPVSGDVLAPRVGYSRGTWEPGSQEILGPQAKYLTEITRLS